MILFTSLRVFPYLQIQLTEFKGFDISNKSKSFTTGTQNEEETGLKWTVNVDESGIV